MALRWRAVCGTLWLVALTAVAIIGGRSGAGDEISHDVVIRHGPGAAAGVVMVLFTLPSILVAVLAITHRVSTLVAHAAGAAVTCSVAWSVLHDTHSTVGIGIFAIPFYAVLIVGSLLMFDRALISN
jgi:hypothetical protein